MKYKLIITRVIASLGAMMILAFVSAPTLAACNNSLSLDNGIGCATPSGASQNALFPTGGGGLFQTIADTLILVIGAVSVLMIIVGALRYVLSSGNPQATAGAKDTILYAVIGLVVAILAFAIVNFVITHIK